MSLRTTLPSIRARAAAAAPRPCSRTFTSSARAFAEAAAESSFTAGEKAGASAARKSSRWGFFALALALPTAFMAGAMYPPQHMVILWPRAVPAPPHKDSETGKAMTAAVEADLQKLAIVEELRNREDWYETRPYKNFDEAKVANSLTGGALRGPGKLAVPPMAFARHDESEAAIVLHLGRGLCGHDGIVHGGLIATVFDESLARNALLNLPTHIGVTAFLHINYRAPCMADQFVVVRTKMDTQKGRKVTVSGRMETLDGQLIADANALFVEPKWAQYLQSSGVSDALGAPEVPHPTSPAFKNANA